MEKSKMNKSEIIQCVGDFFSQIISNECNIPIQQLKNIQECMTIPTEGGWSHYQKKYRSDIKKQNKGMSYKEITQTLTKNWNALSKEEQDSYTPKPTFNKEKYTQFKHTKISTSTQTTPVQVKPAQTTPVQVKPTQTTPVQVKPVQVKPVQTKPVQTKPTPVQAKPKPVQAKPKPTPVQAKPVQAKPVQAKPTPAQAKPTPVQAKPVQPKPIPPPAQAKPVQTTPPPVQVKSKPQYKRSSKLKKNKMKISKICAEARKTSYHSLTTEMIQRLIKVRQLRSNPNASLEEMIYILEQNDQEQIDELDA